jgi:acylphosphatase
MQIVYSGHVQGVGFRYTVRTLACGFELSGTVKNMTDGRVELIAEGERTELEAFAQAIMDSGLGSLIRQAQTSWGEAQNGFRGFEIMSD